VRQQVDQGCGESLLKAIKRRDAGETGGDRQELRRRDLNDLVV
jgi:hypothetical protein